MNVDKIIAMLDWGKDYLTPPDEYQKNRVNFLMKNSAYIFIGVHPHYIQPIEYYNALKNERFVIYSLGNFMSGQRARRKDGGSMLQFTLSKNSAGNVTITKPGYYLNWVWVTIVNNQKRYTICPVSKFHQTDLKNKFPEAELNKFNEFKSDSEKLYNTDNKKVKQYIYNPKSKLWNLELE